MGGVFYMKKTKERGSFFVTLIIIALFMFAAVFYIKTSQPQLYSKAMSFVKETFSQKSGLAEVNADVYDAVTDEKNPSGEILSSADRVTFEYLSANSVTVTRLPLDNAVITSVYGTRTDPVTKKTLATHHGIDLAASENSEIHSFRAGSVEWVKDDAVFGNCVLINHGDLSSFYAHMSKVLVKEGDSVAAGDTVGIIGSTGKSTGTHLHFEIRKNGQRVDPADYLYAQI